MSRKKPTKPRRYADDAPLTKAELATARPMREALPDMYSKLMAGKFLMPDGHIVRPRGRPVGSDKTSIALRVDNDVLAFFKSRGAGWQTRMNAALRAIVEAAGKV